MVANHQYLLAFSRHGQCANLRPLAHAAKESQIIAFGPLIRVPGPSCPAKDNSPALLARFQKLFAVGWGHFRGRLTISAMPRYDMPFNL